MSNRLLVLAAAAALVVGPAWAIGPANVPAPAPSAGAQSCDGCSTQDSDGNTAAPSSQPGDPAQSSAGPSGPSGDAQPGRPVHTDLPTHANVPPPGAGGSPKG